MAGTARSRLSIVEFDDAVVARMVGVALGDSSIDVTEWSAHHLGGGMTQALGTSEGVSRIEGVGIRAGRRMPWSIIVKVLRRSPDHGDPADWSYWKREALAYQADLLVDLADGFDAPRCFGVDEADDDHVALWLEDIRETGPASWPLARFGVAARHLGRFSGAYLSGRALPDPPWLSLGRVRQWLVSGEPGIADLPRLAKQPIGSAWLTGDAVVRMQWQWRERQTLLGGLERLPRCLCHHDAFRRNLIAGRTPGGSDRTVAVDWGGVGLGVVGEDLATLVAISLQFLEVDVVDAAALDRVAFDGYVAGLRDVGASIEEREVRFGFDAVASLLLGVGGAGGWLLWLLEDDDRPRLAEGIIGHPIDEILVQWRGLQPYLLDLGDEAHHLARDLGWA